MLLVLLEVISHVWNRCVSPFSGDKATKEKSCDRDDHLWFSCLTTSWKSPDILMETETMRWTQFSTVTGFSAKPGPQQGNAHTNTISGICSLDRNVGQTSILVQTVYGCHPGSLWVTYMSKWVACSVNSKVPLNTDIVRPQRWMWLKLTSTEGVNI